MLVKTKALVISTIRYQDKSLIVKCYTQSDGLKSYFVRNVFTSKSSKNKASYFQPLSLLEIEAMHKNKNSLDYFNHVKPVIYQTLHQDYLKSSLVLFLSEVLQSSLKDEQRDENLFLFLETALLWLDQNPTNNNFHLLFMCELSKYLGFYPSRSSCSFFDMQAGIFVDEETQECLSGSQSDLLKELLSLRIDQDVRIFNNSQRRMLLDIMIKYYTIHIENFKKPNSLEVFKEVFS